MTMPNYKNAKLVQLVSSAAQSEEATDGLGRHASIREETADYTPCLLMHHYEIRIQFIRLKSYRAPS